MAKMHNTLLKTCVYVKFYEIFANVRKNCARSNKVKRMILNDKEYRFIKYYTKRNLISREM